jgi:putative transferase (TIGR04331 family)
MSFQKWKLKDQRINIPDIKFKENFNEVNNLYEHSLKNLIYILNKIHNIQEDRRFWETLLGAWLSSFINICHSEFLKRSKILNNRVKIQSCYNYEDYNKHTYNDFFRYNLCKAIKSKDLIIKIINNKKKIFCRSFFKFNLYRIFYFFFSLNYIINIPSRNIWIKYSNLRFLILKNKSTIPNKYNYEQRKNIRNFYLNIFNKKKLSNFYINFYNILPFYLPISYLEQFRLLNEKYKNIENLKKIISTHAHIVDDEFKFLLVNARKKKTKIYFYQHGGGYLYSRYSLNQKFEYNCCDQFLFWGNFNKNKKKKLRNFYINRLLNFKKNKKNNKISNNYLIFFKDFFRYNFSTTEHIPNYFFRIYKYLIIKLNSFCHKNQIILRLYGSNIRKVNKYYNLIFYIQKLKKKFSDYGLISFSDIDMYKQANSAKLNIFTYCGTACLELISLNFPSVIYIDKRTCNNYYTKDFYNQMLYFKKNNIFFENHDVLVKFIKKTDINQWWFSKKNQVVISKFRALFCRKINEKDLYKKLINV